MKCPVQPVTQSSLDRAFYFHILGKMETKAAIAALSALAQESRLAVYRRLIEAGPEGLPAGRIAAELGLANATLSFHLKALAQAGLIEGRQQGRFVIYSPNFTVSEALVAFLTNNCCGGQPELCRPGTPAAAPGKESKSA